MNDRDAIAALVSDLHWQIDQLKPRGIKNNAGQPYNPSYYKRGLENAINRGGRAVADYVRRYVYKPPSDGYKKLEEADSLDLACESLVADQTKPYAHLFSEADRAAARERLAPHIEAIEERKAANTARGSRQRVRSSAPRGCRGDLISTRDCDRVSSDSGEAYGRLHLGRRMKSLSFKECEARRVAAVSPLVFGFPTDGVMLPAGKSPENLHPTLRKSALDYFALRGIKWWRWPPADSQEPPGPTRLLRSSQVACVNHLMPARDDEELALLVARSVVPDAQDVLPIDDGFVAFEWIGARADIGEVASRSRGAHRTNLDALLVVRTRSGRRIGVVIEWKLSETYTDESLVRSRRGTDRTAIYRARLCDPDGPIAVERLSELSDIFVDPYLQLARQTLLAWRLAEDDDLFDDWVHLHVIPAGNRELLNVNTAPQLRAASMTEAWRTVLRAPQRYRHVVPTELLSHLPATAGPPGWRSWLAARYGT